MSDIELYKYIAENGIEWHWGSNKGEEDVIIFPNFYQLDSFCKLVGSFTFDDDGIDCVLQDGYLAIWMNSICEDNDIELINVFNKKGANSEYDSTN